MRRLAAALGFGLILVLTGCASGDVTDGWAPMPAARQFRPEPGKCQADLDEASLLSAATDYKPIACGSPHKTETLAVFDLSPADASSTNRRLAKAYSECSKRTTAWLGKDWRTGFTTILPMLPSERGWAGGARWVRCDVAEVSPERGDVIERKGSLKGALKPGGKLVASCANPAVAGPDVTDLNATACSNRHTAEFAGLYVSKKQNPEDLTDAEFGKGCYPVIAKFAGVPNDSDLHYRVGWVIFLPSDAAWYRGDHAIRCYLWLDEKKTGSYRKAGPGKLPVR